MVDLLALLGGIAVGSLVMALFAVSLRRAPVPAPARVAGPPPAPSPYSAARPRTPAHPQSPARPQPAARSAGPAVAPSADATAVYPGSAPRSAPGRTSTTTTRLELEDGSAGVDLTDKPVTLGRGADQSLRIVDSRASRAHAVVRPRRTGGWELADDGSSNGTTLNGHRIPDGKVAPLRDGDRIGIADTTVLYVEGRPEPALIASEATDDPTRT